MNNERYPLPQLTAPPRSRSDRKQRICGNQIRGVTSKRRHSTRPPNHPDSAPPTRTGDLFQPYRLVDAEGVVIAPVAAYFAELSGRNRL